MYENVNWQAYLAFNNSFGLAQIPTGAQINGAPARLDPGRKSVRSADGALGYEPRIRNLESTSMR